jgi:hypothetical protein
MPDDVITDKEEESAPIETGAWEIAFNPYARDAAAAFDLARRLLEVKRLLLTNPPNVSLAKAALDDACELLFPLTEFRQVAYDLYLTALDGHPTKAQEDLMGSLGIKY